MNETVNTYLCCKADIFQESHTFEYTYEMIWPSLNTFSSNEPGFLIIYFAFSASYFSSYSFPCEYYVLILPRKKNQGGFLFLIFLE